MAKISQAQKDIIIRLATDLFSPHNASSLGKSIGITRVGAFKALKSLEAEGLVKGQQMGKSRFYSLNLKEEYAKKHTELILLERARDYKRWIDEFMPLYDYIDLAILFGSVTKDEAKANDIDLLLVYDRKYNAKINSIVSEKNQVLTRKIHLVKQTEEDFKANIMKKDKIILGIFSNGIILHGINKFLEDIANVTDR